METVSKTFSVAQCLQRTLSFRYIFTIWKLFYPAFDESAKHYFIRRVILCIILNALGTRQQLKAMAESVHQHLRAEERDAQAAVDASRRAAVDCSPARRAFQGV